MDGSQFAYFIFLAEMCALSKSNVMFDVRFTRQSVESKRTLCKLSIFSRSQSIMFYGMA